MSETESVKVYELAKELGLPPLELVDKLNGLNIKVKSHMSPLEADQVSRARAELSEKKSAAAAKKPAAARTRKKAETAAADAPKAAAAKAAPAKAPATKAAAVAKAAATTKAAAPAPAETPAPAASGASPIIRRRVKSDGVTETLSAPVPGYQRTTTEELQAQQAEEELQAQADAFASGQHDSEEEQDEQAESESENQEEASLSGESEQASAPAEPQQSSEETAQQAASETPAASASAPGTTGEAPRPARAPVVLPPRPVAPRRSILKVVDLTAPPPRPMIKPAAGPVVSPVNRPKPGAPQPSGDGFRIIKLTKENLDQMTEEEAAKKRGGGGRVPEIRPEDVRFADYRKKEMVFLPKKKKLPVGKQIRQTNVTTAAQHKRYVEMEDTISVQDFANQLSVKAVDVVRKLMKMGVMASVNQAIDFDTATLIASEYQYEVRNVAFKEQSLLNVTEDKPEQLQARPPVVTIMGHVDHGKTTLLDAIREANVAGGEAGGITQHIGAYTVYPKGSDGKIKNDKPITFIDTPGHEAFSVMRARGANVTDIVILVVSADDGVMPQTREAVSHAQAAKVPIIVAVNKIDKPGANPEKIKQGLSELNLLAEDWGGDTMFIPVSALKKTNLDKLLEGILLQAEVLDLKGNPDVRATGTVLEARLEKWATRSCPASSPARSKRSPTTRDAPSSRPLPASPPRSWVSKACLTPARRSTPSKPKRTRASSPKPGSMLCAPRSADRLPRSASRSFSPSPTRARPKSSISSSKPTCSAPSKRSRKASSSSPTPRSRSRCSTPLPAGSPRATSFWLRLRARSLLDLMFAPRPKRAKWPRPSTSKSRRTRSSTSCSTTSAAP
jgi:translation initiation factor IF-2